MYFRGPEFLEWGWYEMTDVTSAGVGPSDGVRHAQLAKAPTGIAGFDGITFAGVPRGRATPVTGGAGAGKTLFGLEFLVRGALTTSSAPLDVDPAYRLHANCHLVKPLSFSALARTFTSISTFWLDLLTPANKP
jgi:hypothetical protein